MTKKIFNAALQREAEYTLEVDNYNDILATCVEDGSILKFPNVSEAEFDVLTARHADANLGQYQKKPLFGGTVSAPEVEVVPEIPAS